MIAVPLQSRPPRRCNTLSRRLAFAYSCREAVAAAQAVQVQEKTAKPSKAQVRVRVFAAEAATSASKRKEGGVWRTYLALLAAMPLASAAAAGQRSFSHAALAVYTCSSPAGSLMC